MDQARFADPGLTGDQDEAAASGGGAPAMARKKFDLALARDDFAGRVRG